MLPFISFIAGTRQIQNNSEDLGGASLLPATSDPASLLLSLCVLPLVGSNCPLSTSVPPCGLHILVFHLPEDHQYRGRGLRSEELTASFGWLKNKQMIKEPFHAAHDLLPHSSMIDFFSMLKEGRRIRANSQGRHLIEEAH